MKRYLFVALFFLFVQIPSFAQQESLQSKSYYLLDEYGRRMKFNFLDNNKFEMVTIYGDYQIINDSLLFKNNFVDKSVFEVQYVKNTQIKRDKIKISFEEDATLYGIYIGTQNGKDSINYKRVNNIIEYDSNLNKSFEIDRAQYLYFVSEGFDYEPRVIFKYEIPASITELKVKVNYLLPNTMIKGYLDRKKNELSIGENDLPAVFYSEEPNPVLDKSIIPPLEKKQVATWTYPGKEAADDSEVAVATDNENLPETDFKLKIEKSLPEALQQTKIDGNKFLVVYSDLKNPEAQTEFDFLIEKQERYIGYVSSNYDPQYNLYNFYLASKQDESWLKKNKMTDVPVLMILDENETILAWAKSSLTPEKLDNFNYYDSFNSKLKRISIKNNFEQAVTNKNVGNTDLLKAFYYVSVLGSLGDYDYEYSEENANKEDFKFIKFDLDKKKARQVWEKLLEMHQNDASPDMLLVQAILQEIKGVGYTKQVYLEDKVLDEVDFKSIDYLIKHYDSIDAKRKEFNDLENAPIQIGNLSTEISNALQNSTSLYNEDGSYTKSDQKKIKEVYEKLIQSDKGHFEFYKNYFNYLADNTEKAKNNNDRIAAFEKYFDKYLVNKENIIQNLDKLFDNAFDTNSLYYYDWKEFKEYHSNLCNEIAWSTIFDNKIGYIKKAINWSECSLLLSKNNPYYLDTLAQLYYKDGQQQKAIETQVLAVKFITSDIDGETANQMKEVLTKMSNGTY